MRLLRSLNTKGIIALFFLFLIVIVSLLYCSTPQYVDLTEDIEAVMQDESLPEPVRVEVANRLLKRNIDGIRVVAKRNSKLESRVESNQWKVNLVDGIIYTAIAILILIGVFFAIRFYFFRL